MQLVDDIYEQATRNKPVVGRMSAR
jgi:hypothetical protein